MNYIFVLVFLYIFFRYVPTRRFIRWSVYGLVVYLWYNQRTFRSPFPPSVGGPLITRETFMAPNYVEIALASGTMMIQDEEHKWQTVPLPEGVQEAGILPKGFAVDFVMDPDQTVQFLNSQGATTEDQLTPELIEGFVKALNDPQNLKIIPHRIWKTKRAMSSGNWGDLLFGDLDDSESGIIGSENAEVDVIASNEIEADITLNPDGTES
ncbi:hypothetical protein BT69DRAFT_1351415 [Atractiella rhizophila]|nr:hypothetical protein BT69DRAFT_1351415 [Atractiella rhizophila]